MNSSGLSARRITKNELERVRRLEAITVDFVQPGEPQPNASTTCKANAWTPVNIRVVSGGTHATVAGCRSI